MLPHCPSQLVWRLFLHPRAIHLSSNGWFCPRSIRLDTIRFDHRGGGSLNSTPLSIIHQHVQIPGAPHTGEFCVSARVRPSFRCCYSSQSCCQTLIFASSLSHRTIGRHAVTREVSEFQPSRFLAPVSPGAFALGLWMGSCRWCNSVEPCTGVQLFDLLLYSRESWTGPTRRQTPSAFIQRPCVGLTLFQPLPYYPDDTRQYNGLNNDSISFRFRTTSACFSVSGSQDSQHLPHLYRSAGHTKPSPPDKRCSSKYRYVSSLQMSLFLVLNFV
jgi:hypothetical protein